VAGKHIPPPPRRVIIERLAPLPAKPRSVIIERWLSYPEQKRRVIFMPAAEYAGHAKQSNLIIQWEAPKVIERREFKDLGVVRANPQEYLQHYGTSLVNFSQLPDFAHNLKPPSGFTLACSKSFQSSQSSQQYCHKLEGDTFALKMCDLEKEGLGMYNYLFQQQQQTQQQPSELVKLRGDETKEFEYRELPKTHQVTYPVGSQTLAETKMPSVPLDWSIGEQITRIQDQLNLVKQQTSEHQLKTQQQHQQQTTTTEKVKPSGFVPESVVSQVFNTANHHGGLIARNEAMRLLSTLNDRLNRKFDEQRCEKFLHTLNKMSNDMFDFEEFKSAVIKKFYN